MSNTFALFRIIENKYIDSFLKGNLYFGTPENWLVMENDDCARGDSLEGVFLITHQDRIKIPVERKQYLVAVNQANETIVYDKRILKVPCLCFYKIDDNVNENGDLYIKKEYLKEFNINKGSSLVIIHNPTEFLKRILNVLGIEKGLDCDFYSVIYDIKTNEMYNCFEVFPFELRHKRENYSYQNEIRMILDYTKLINNSNLVYDKDKKGYFLNIGPIDDICKIHDYTGGNLGINISNSKMYVFEDKLASTKEDIIEYLDYTISNLSVDDFALEKNINEIDLALSILSNKYGFDYLNIYHEKCDKLIKIKKYLYNKKN